MTAAVSLPKLRRFMALSDLQKLFAHDSSKPPSVRSMQRWCQQGDWPARRRGSGKWEWEVDILALKTENRELYERVVDMVNAAAHQ